MNWLLANRHFRVQGWTRLFAIGFLFCWIGVLAGQPPVPEASLPSLRDIVEHLKHRLDGAKTVHSIVVIDHRNQKEFFANLPPLEAGEGEIVINDQRDWWSRIAEDMDDLGRYRRVDRGGNYGADGSRLPPTAPEQIHLYDGEKTVAKGHTTGKDNVYVPGQGFPTAVIFDGRAQLTLERPGQCYALSFPTNGVVQILQKCLEAQAEVTVKRVPGGAHSYELSYVYPGTAEAAQITVDSGRGWIITKWAAKVKDGQPLSECTYSYVRTEAGFWALKHARCRTWSNKAPMGSAPREEIYTVEEIRLNEPIPEETFRISLDPNTLVSDRRYNLNYRVGAEKALDADIQKLAAAAGAPITLPPPPDRRWIWSLILGNVALVASVILLVSWYRKRRAAIAKP